MASIRRLLIFPSSELRRLPSPAMESLLMPATASFPSAIAGKRQLSCCGHSHGAAKALMPELAGHGLRGSSYLASCKSSDNGVLAARDQRFFGGGHFRGICILSNYGRGFPSVARRPHGDIDRGQRAAEEALALDPQHGRAYVALSNIYAAAGRWEDVARIRKMMKDRGIKKEPGKSTIEVNGKVHEFIAGDRSHKNTNEIYAELTRMREEFEEWGYEPDLKLVLHDVEEEQKVHLLWRHSEKLAMAFGHLNTPPGTTLRVIKNLRVCPDCHLVSKYISKLYGRDIIMRDANRFHHFHDGTCSCNDYW